jgi:multidrug efflux system membrane fusion protein
VQLQLRTIQNAVVVPVTAVRQSGNGEFVFVLQADRTVKQRPIVRGQMLADRVQDERPAVVRSPKAPTGCATAPACAAGRSPKAAGRQRRGSSVHRLPAARPARRIGRAARKRRAGVRGKVAPRWKAQAGAAQAAAPAMAGRVRGRAWAT